MYTHFFPLSEAVEFLLAQFPLLSTDYKIFDQTNQKYLHFVAFIKFIIQIMYMHAYKINRGIKYETMTFMS